MGFVVFDQRGGLSEWVHFFCVNRGQGMELSASNMQRRTSSSTLVIVLLKAILKSSS